MAYNGSNLSCINETMSGGRKIWIYESTDAIATVKGAGYFSDATARGMKTRDLVWVLDTETPTTTLCTVTVTNGAGSLGTGVTITE